MDPDVAGWILEFGLRQKWLDDLILDKLFRILPLPDHNLSLKKTLILRRIETEIAKGRVSKIILDLLEYIVELDLRMGIKEVSEAMKSAYCSVAVDCTIRALEERDDDARDAKYSDAVEAIWRGKVNALRRCKIGVVSESLESWNREIELYLWDPGFCDNLVEKKNKSIDALGSVRVYVKDAEAKMGPPFLEVAADLLIRNNRLDLMEPMIVSNAGHNMEDRVRVYESRTTGHDAGHDMECDQVRDHEPTMTVHNVGPDALVNDSNIEGLEEDIPQRSKHVGARRKSVARKSRGALRTSRGAKIVDVEELDDEMPTAVVNKVHEALETGPLEPQEMCLQGDDSVGPSGSTEGSSSRPYPPSSKKSFVTPLQEDQVNKPRKRRRSKPWSLLEEDSLRIGVQTYGKGNWKLILTMHRDIFEERTEVKALASFLLLCLFCNIITFFLCSELGIYCSIVLGGFERQMEESNSLMILTSKSFFNPRLLMLELKERYSGVLYSVTFLTS